MQSFTDEHVMMAFISMLEEARPFPYLNLLRSASSLHVLLI